MPISISPASAFAAQACSSYHHPPDMAGERVKLQVRERERRGSADARRLRREGYIPGVLYGNGKASHAICIPERDLRRVLTGAGGLHAILDVVLEGQKTTHASILKDYQQDPIRGHISHVDLQEVRLDQPIQAVVVVQLVGEAAGTKEGGVLTQVSRELNVEALPTAIPEHIDADVSEMHIGDTLRLADIGAVDGVTFLDDPDETVLAIVTQPTRVEAPEQMVEEEEEGAEEAAVPSGEQAPEKASEAPAEPGANAGGEGAPGTTAG
jgi:large subunit ribosomal protein L25